MFPDSLLILLPAPPATPGTPTVSFQLAIQHFTITWDEPPLYTGETVDAYFVNVSGPDDLCGSVNTLQRLRNSTHNYTCSGWTMPPAGQTYTFTVQAANCGGDLRGPDSDTLTVSLQGTYVQKTLVCVIMVTVYNCLYNKNMSEDLPHLSDQTSTKFMAIAYLYIFFPCVCS